MEPTSQLEWIVAGIFVAANAYRRYNNPTSNRSTTTFINFSLYFVFYLISILTVYVFFGAVFDSSPETFGALYKLMMGDVSSSSALPGELKNLSAPMVSALFLTTLLPSIPGLAHYDRALLHVFWDRGNIPNHVHNMAAVMRRSPFRFSPAQIKKLQRKNPELPLNFHQLKMSSGINLDYRWARINALLDSIYDWKDDDSGRLRRFMEEHKDELAELENSRLYINTEYSELRSDNLHRHAINKIERLLDKSIADLFRKATIFVAKVTCMVELSESGRCLRISQLGFEGGVKTSDRLSPSQIASAFFWVLFVFFCVSMAQELGKDFDTRKFGNVLFMTLLMAFTYGAALVIALDLKGRVGMGYNELTSHRSWFAYIPVAAITALSWALVTISYRYIYQMLSGMDSASNIDSVLTNIGWSFPYALQSIALAVALSWILDYHQRHGLNSTLTFQQRIFDVGITVATLTVASITAFYWMEGLGWFEHYATKDPQYTGKTSALWFILKGASVGAVVAWLVPMWFYINRTKSPDQIACRLINMNAKELSREIRTLAPNDLLEAVSAVAASVSAIDDDISRAEEDVYQIICSHLAGLNNSDIDINTTEQEFVHCLELIETNELHLEDRLRKLSNLPLLMSLMPFLASSIAFADGIYLDREREVVELIRRMVNPENGILAPAH